MAAGLDGELAQAEPKRLRNTLLHSAGVLVRSARRTMLRNAEGLALGRRPRGGRHPTTELVQHLVKISPLVLSQHTPLLEHGSRSDAGTTKPLKHPDGP